MWACGCPASFMDSAAGWARSGAQIAGCPFVRWKRWTRPLTRNPASGKRGMAQIRLFTALSALHRVRLFDVQRPALAEEGNRQREPDRGFARGDRDHEDREDLPRQVGKPPGKSDEIDVDGVEHQLDGHEHGQEVA